LCATFVPHPAGGAGSTVHKCNYARHLLTYGKAIKDSVKDIEALLAGVDVPDADPRDGK
jgi:predicted secreted Zn-dependent protease